MKSLPSNNLAKMITKLRPKQPLNELVGNCIGREHDRSMKIQCNWSKVLRFAPGMKFRPDELFEVFYRCC